METNARASHFKFAALAVAVAALVAVFALFGCSSSSSSTSSSASSASTSSSASSASADQQVTFTDDLGREVTVNKNPQRVVAGMGSFADMWQLAGGTLVGAPDEAFTSYDIDSATVASIGGFASISQESILALSPDFVILTGNSTGQAGTASQTDLEQALTDADIPVAYFKVTTFDDYLRVMKTLCDITGREDLYKDNGTDIQDAINKAIDTYKPAAEGKTYMLGITYSQGVRVQRSSTQTGDMLSELGAVNIADTNSSLLSDFSVESLLEIDPEYIFLIPMGTDDASTQASLDNLTSNEAWSSLSAVKNGKVFVLPRALYSDKPDAKWAEAYEGLGKDFE